MKLENKSTKSILFVCLGNICRSPTAEAIFLKVLAQHNKTREYHVDSCGTIGYHQGELPDARMRMHAARRGYELTHRSRPFTRADFDTFDMIIGMDDQNYSALIDKAHTLDEKNKIYKMTDFCVKFEATHIPDPYYGGDKGFENVIDLLEDACGSLFEKIEKNEI